MAKGPRPARTRSGPSWDRLDPNKGKPGSGSSKPKPGSFLGRDRDELETRVPDQTRAKPKLASPGPSLTGKDPPWARPDPLSPKIHFNVQKIYIIKLFNFDDFEYRIVQ